MHNVYFVFVLLGVFLAGALLGLFLKARVAGVFVGVVLSLLFAAFLIGAVTGNQSAIWMAGVSLMAAPVLGAILFLGAVSSNTAIAALRRRQQPGVGK